MSPELREFVLSLPLDVRRELAKVKEPGWYACRYPTHFAQTLCEESGTVADNDAFLPVSPIAIALHAANLSGRGGSHVVAVSVHPCYGFASSTAYMGSNPSPRHKPDVQVNYEDTTDDDTAKDPTGHRAAIALLQKVMDERKVPNAEP